MDDALFSDQWNLRLLNIPKAWSYTQGHGVKVGILDSGIDGSHKDFGWLSQINITANDGEGLIYDKYRPVLEAIRNGEHPKIVKGWNCVGDTDYTWDAYRHGTYVSGIIGAMANSFGMIGVAPGCKLMPYVVVDGNGYGTYQTVCDGIKRAVDDGADIINISLAFSDTRGKSEWESAINYAYTNNVIIVSATGNNNTRREMYPAGFDGVIAVGGCDESGKRWVHNTYRGSNYGVHTHCICPASSQPTTFFMRWRHTNIDGTSLASANMTGIVALCRSVARIGYDEMVELVKRYSSGSVIGRNDEVGWGVPDVYRMVSNLLPDEVDTVEVVKSLNSIVIQIGNVIKKLGG